MPDRCGAHAPEPSSPACDERCPSRHRSPRVPRLGRRPAEPRERSRPKRARTRRQGLPGRSGPPRAHAPCSTPRPRRAVSAVQLSRRRGHSHPVVAFEEINRGSSRRQRQGRLEVPEGLWCLHPTVASGFPSAVSSGTNPSLTAIASRTISCCERPVRADSSRRAAASSSLRRSLVLMPRWCHLSSCVVPLTQTTAASS
jgi:hypothetical protein